MVRSGLLDSNQREKCCFAADKSSDIYRYKLHSALDNKSPHLAWYGKNLIINELRTFGYDIYPIT